MRLANDIRRDVHLAKGFQISNRRDQPATIRLNLPDGKDVTYQATNGRILRQQRLDAEQTAYETYDFPNDYRLTFSQPLPQLAEVVVEHDPKLMGVEPLTVVHVKAEVGRLLRLAGLEEDSP